MNKIIYSDKALHLIDEVVPKFLALSDMKMKDSLYHISVIFRKSGAKSISHMQSHWKGKKGEFGSFYLNLDDKNQRIVLEYFGIKVEPDKFPNSEDLFMAQLNGKDYFEVYPFETIMLFKFLLMANNHSLEEVEGMEHGHLLLDHLQKSKLSAYGTGVNWGKFYQYLIDHKISERKSIVEYAYSN